MQAPIYAWWPSPAHFGTLARDPVAISSDWSRIEAHAREHAPTTKPAPVIGELDDAGWHPTHLVQQTRTRSIPDAEIEKHVQARRGGSRGNLGPIPTDAAVQTVNLDE